MRVKDIFWLRDKVEYPITFEYKKHLMEFTNAIVPDSIKVYGVLRNGYNYRGTTIVFLKVMKNDITGISTSRKWLDLETFIKLFGDFTTKEQT